MGGPEADPGFPIDARALPSLRDEPCRYPDARPLGERTPFLYAGGRVRPLRDGEEPAALLWEMGAAGVSERIAVVAVGSNAYPRQLLDKFSARPVSDDSVPTLRCRVKNLAIGYAAALSSKGYVPATLRHQPGAICQTWLQLLSAEQLTVIAETEGRSYRLVRLPGVEVQGLVGLTAAFGWAHSWLLDPGAGPLDLDTLDQGALLRRALAGVESPADWDGCRLGPSSREYVKRWLKARARANDLPSAWEPIDRMRTGFSAALSSGEWI